MARRRIEVEVPEGTRLGIARDASGARRGLLFDLKTNKLVGHADLFEYDDSRSATPKPRKSKPKRAKKAKSKEKVQRSESNESSDTNSEPEDEWLSRKDEDDDEVSDELSSNEIAEIIAAIVVELTIRGVKFAAPHVKRWWIESAIPTAKSTPGRLKSVLKRRGTPADPDRRVGVIEIAESEPFASSTPGDSIERAEFGPPMMSSEARRHLASAAEAIAYARDQIDAIQSATIVVDDGDIEVAFMLSELSPENLFELLERIRRDDELPLELEGTGDVAIGTGVVAPSHSLLSPKFDSDRSARPNIEEDQDPTG